MAFKEPESMNECLYFTFRTLEDGKGRIKAWVYRKQCPKCKKARLGKPVNPKTGKADKKSNIYKCPECGYEEPLEKVEGEVKIEVIYTCPYCNNNGETTTEYTRKKFEGVDSYVFVCQKCGKKIPITKKMKNIKKKEG